MPEYLLIPTERIAPPPEPVRMAMDEPALDDLAHSIRAVGILEPLIVVSAVTAEQPTTPQEDPEREAKKTPAPGYEIVAGHRRYLAGLMAGLAALPCLVFDDVRIAREAVMLHENIYREDLTPAEEGHFYLDLVEKYTLNEEQLLRLVRQSATYVYARINLVKGDADVAFANQQRKINLAVATELLKCTDAEHRRYLLHNAIESAAPQKVVKQWIADWRANYPPAAQGGDRIHVAEVVPVYAPPASVCFLCGEAHTPQLMKVVYIHQWEWVNLKKVLQESGVEVIG